MNNLIFWIIVCSWLIPMGIRMYNRSRQRRIRNGDDGNNGYGSFPETPPGQFPNQQYPGSPFPGQYHPRQNYPGPPPVVIPAEPQPPVPTPAPQAAPPSSTTQPNTVPQGYRARKLAELDRQYSDGKIAMEDYMKLRQEIMNG